MTRKKRSLINNRTQRKTPTSQLSYKNIHFLKKSWQSICKYKALPCPPHNQFQTADIQHIQKTGMYPHIPEKIRHMFESSQHQGIKCETELLRGRKVVIYIASTTPVHYDVYLNNIVAWLNFIGDIASQSCAQTLNIYLLLTDAKKQLPEIDTEPIDQIHANTAFTTSCSSANDIFVYRREEWFKVFMHETFHCFGLDFSSSSGDESNSRILSHFPALSQTTDIRLYETFCELWGEVFHLLFCLFTDKNGKCRPFSEAKFYKALRKEQKFSIYQSNKILRRAGYQYKDLFSEPLDKTKKYKENTPAFSYYVIKSLMLWNLDKFMNWCVKYSEKHPIQFNHKHIAEYCDLVEYLTAHDGGYKKTVERIIPFSKKVRGGASDKSSEGDPDLSETLRMTAVDPRWY
jgi:hypothetical protein